MCVCARRIQIRVLNDKARLSPQPHWPVQTQPQHVQPERCSWHAMRCDADPTQSRSVGQTDLCKVHAVGQPAPHSCLLHSYFS
jgi:hypothetical protein